MRQYHLIRFLIAIVITLASAGTLAAQSTNQHVNVPDKFSSLRVSVPIADPSRPVQLRAHLLNGSITVKGADVKEILVEAKAHDGDDDEQEPELRRDGGRSSGMKRIPMGSSGLNIDSDNNVVRISTDSVRRTSDLVITVPVHTSASLHTVNNGNIVVSGIDGELDVNNVNGSVTLKNISGSVVAHALNGQVLVTFNRVDAKAMSFSSLNGDIDVTFPANVKANLSMRTDNGEVYSDFDVQLANGAPSQQQVVEDERGRGGKYRVKVDKTVRGTINGGGPEIQFKNFNGNIYIRKAGAPRP
jgi:DUF4097 and DUF4098 domain-containing protein YvlB